MPVVVDTGELDVTVVAVGAFPTRYTSGADGPTPLKFASPEYVAVIECDPGASEEEEHDALPPAGVMAVIVVVEQTLTGEPLETSLNVTVPVGVPYEVAIVAVKITVCP